MKGIAKYSQEYVDSMGFKQWSGLELEFDQTTKHPLEALDEVEKLVKQKVAQSTGNYKVNINGSWELNSQQQIPEIQIKPEDREIGLTVEHIMSCEDITILNSYRLLVSKDEELLGAFNQRFWELNNRIESCLKKK
jgi:hypothetical protein